MRKRQINRPYLKCSLKFDWHIEPPETTGHFLNILAEYLVEKGFKRPGGSSSRCSGKKRRGTGEVKMCESEVTNAEKIWNENREMVDDKVKASCREETIQKTTFAVIGMRSVLRKMRGSALAAIYFDANTVKPSSVGTTLGLYAASLENTKVYAISGLSETLSKALNLSRVGSLGLMNIPDNKEICNLSASVLTNVSILNGQQSSIIATTEVQVPVGKKKKKRNK